MLFILIAIVCLLFLALYLIRSGIFYNVNIRTGHPPFGKVLIAYKFYIGSYFNVGSALKELDSFKLKNKLKRLAIYYDDPNKMKKGKHRYIVGVVLNQNESESVDYEAQSTLEQNGFKIVSFPEIKNGIITEFPIRTNLSPLVSICKVYPKFGKYFQKQNVIPSSILEYYDDGMTHFAVPLENEESYFVREYLIVDVTDPFYEEHRNSKKVK